LVFFVSLLLAVISPMAYLFLEDSKFQNRMYPRVEIDNIRFSGETKDEALKILYEREKRIQKTVIRVKYKDAVVATYSGELLGLQSNSAEVLKRAYSYGRNPNIFLAAIEKILVIYRLRTFSLYSNISYNRQYVEDTVNQFEEIYNKPAKNALFKFENDRVVSFAQEEKGNRIHSSRLLTDIDQSIRSLKYQQMNFTFTLTEEPVNPEIILSQANGYGIEEEIGKGVSNYSHSIPGRIHNVILAASKFNGVLIPKGKIFSFNDTIGDISAQTGYQPAYIIKEGKTVLGDGGGVCQVSTTLFRAALNAGLPIVERYPHAYRVSYYENDSKPGLDATVFAPSVDLKIENNTDAAILIQTAADQENMILTFNLYGKKDSRKIELSTPVLFDVGPPPDPLYQDDPTLKRGEVKQIDFAAWGGKATFNYKVTRGNEVLFEKQFFSVYRPWRAVFLVGTQD